MQNGNDAMRDSNWKKIGAVATGRRRNVYSRIFLLEFFHKWARELNGISLNWFVMDGMALKVPIKIGARVREYLDKDVYT